MSRLDSYELEYISTHWNEVDKFVVNLIDGGLEKDLFQHEEVYDYDWYYFSENQTLRYPLSWRIDSWYSLGGYFNGVELYGFENDNK